MCPSAGRWIKHLGTTWWLLARWVASCEETRRTARRQLTLTGRIAANVLGASMARIMTLPAGWRASREQRRDSNLHFANHKTNVHGERRRRRRKARLRRELQRSIPAVRATYICFVAFCVSRHQFAGWSSLADDNLVTHQLATDRPPSEQRAGHLPVQSLRHLT